MRKLQQNTTVRAFRFNAGFVALLMAAILWVNPRSAYADITNVIWQGALSGKLAIQQYNSKLIPRISIAKFTNKSFISMVGGSSSGTTIGSTTVGTSASGEVLGINLVMAGGQTNFFLSLYDLTNRKNSIRITTNETVVLVSDGTNLTFTVEAPMVATRNTWGGGFLRIAGTGRVVRGVPSALNGAVDGVLVDNRPGDLNGTTGLVLRARLTTYNVPLRVLPQD